MMSMVLGFGAAVATPVALTSAAAMKQTALRRETNETHLNCALLALDPP
jgi:hypothetical protein